MDFDDDMSDPAFDMDNDSEDYSPAPKAKAPAKKAAATNAAPKKPTKAALAKLAGKPAASKKRAKPTSDDEDNASDGDFGSGSVGNLSQTPPSASKQKKPPAKKPKSAGKPLAEIANDSVSHFDGADDAPAPSQPTSNKTASEMYQKLTQLEHIIKRPDTYIGSVEHLEQPMWVFNKETTQMEKRNVSFVPGLYKIFDEILVNAADNKQRDPGMTMLKVTVSRESGEISVENNGKGIAVEMHQKEKVYIPELLFGHLLTGSNYDDNEKKTVGGRNGYGAKLCNVFSTDFTIECQDSTNGKRYKQSWHNNMSVMDKAKITSNKTSDFVRVTFTPDYKRFNMPDGIDDDLEALIYRRVYDMAGVVDGVKVYLNGEHLKVGFKKYCDLYAKAIAQERDEEVTGEALPDTATVQFEDTKLHRRWQIGFTVSDGTFQQVSFVNSIATTSGGTHVNYIADQICTALLTDLNKKKKGHSLKLSHIRNHIFIFVNCFIDNPAFNSQTKEQMTTKVSAFGSKCVLSDAFLKKIRNSDAINNIIHFAERKADKMLSKSDGNKRSRISNDKLVDANLAGTKHGHECTLILTEGDSARGLAVAGRAVLDPDRIGVFPLRGKLLNVRDASIDQITKNKEIQNIKQFLGLKHKQVYTDTKGLRYGHLMIMADQDHDGSHIKGLLINFLQVQFPSLLLIPDFFQEFITPVVKIWQGSNPKKPTKTKAFYTIPEYDEWKETHAAEVKRWEHKYLKGLGSSSNEDAQVYFTNLDAHLKDFKVMQSDEAQLFDLAFSKKKADARKEWLGNFVPGTFLDQSTKSITYTDFVNKELILFSMADNMRSIPSVLDGFKPGQRKVIYTCFKKNYVKDQKVFELAGTVSKLASYHHGDQSLHQTIVGLAQTFVGSNNVNCLEPSGNFGSRLSGGSDAASARYIFTRLSPFARRVFSPMDEPVLENNVDEGSIIEPKNYAPIVPMVLVNGADGIGTGWSTQIPNYNPVDIVNNLKRRMGRLGNVDGEEAPFEPMVPWFRGWKGTPEPDPTQPGRFRFNGIVFQDDKHPNEINVTELPVRVWTDDFKARLEEVIRAEKSPSWIKDYKEFNDHRNVHFIIQMDDKHIRSALDEGLIERFKLSKTIGTTNLVAFDTEGKIRRYEKVEDIMEEYYNYRFGVYTRRKEHWLRVYHTEYRKIRNQYRFISEIMEGKLVVSKKKKAIVVQELRERKYDAFPKDNGDAKGAKSKDDEDNVEEEEEEDDGGSARDYDYLLSMAIWSFTQERLERLKKQIDAKKEQYDELNSKSEKDLWCADLDEFIKEWENQLLLDSDVQTSIRRMGRRASKKIGAGGGRGRKVKDEDDYVEKKPARAPKVSAAMKALNAAKPVEKTSERFAEMFSAKPKTKPASQKLGADGAEDDFSDDDFAALAKPKKSKTAAAPIAAADRVVDLSDDDEMDEVVPTIASAVAGGRTKRAAAAKAKTWTLDSESDMDEDDNDDEMLGDVGSMVKGIGGSEAKTSGSSANGRLSLFAMSRPETSQGDSSGSGSSVLPKTVRAKPSTKSFDFDSHDDTNYEALALSSPRKSTKGDDDVKSEDDDDDVRPSNATALSTGSTLAKKGRGRPGGGGGGGAKAKAKEDPKTKSASASTQLSPAAKAYATKKAQARAALFDSDDSMDDMEAAPAPRKPAGKAAASKASTAAKPAAKPAAKAATKAAPKRSARAATATKKKPVYVDDDDDDDDVKDEDDEFAMDFD
ncbi:DNA topoisomerase II [Sporothrix brasiliensis 5110]|uniref:DNA topoisomerase 2 n=2 Tax=Sporothrix TaxID=29907 RepID=A0A0C2EZ85_9PEZI|nr:DNA topoisomerase II [Sporothrix brasiliensis 5110]KIH91814.1 DNA topoisomerase II [Sporothrix brasiliensis 5110]